MGKFTDQWSKARKTFLDAEKLADNTIPLSIVEDIEDEPNIAKGLKILDGAKTFADRQKGLGPFMIGRENQQKYIALGLRKCKSPKGTAALKKLSTTIEEIWKEVDEATKPPTPSGEYVSTRTLRQINLVAGCKPKMLTLEPVMVTILVEYDKALAELDKQEKAGLRLDYLGDVAIEVINKWRGAFVETVNKLDARLVANPTAETIKAVSAEGNAAMRYYAKMVEDEATRAVDAEWKRFLQRRKDLSSFRIKTGIKVAIGAVGVSIAVASVVLSFGTAWMNIAAAVKGLGDLGKTIKTACEGIDTTYAELKNDMVRIDALVAQREKARAEGAGQKASKAGEVGREVIAALLPMTKNIVKATSATRDRVVQFSGQISKLESKADDLAGRVEKVTKNLSKIPQGDTAPKQRKLEQDMNKLVIQLFDEIRLLHLRIVKFAEYAVNARKSVEKLLAEDSWVVGKTESLANNSARGVAIFGLCNFIVACAKDGVQILQLL